jgi:predicted MFS family arabinose efflux permease
MAARAVVQREGYRDLLLGQAVSAFGDWMGTVALMALVLDLTGSATAVGVILVLRLLPAGFAGPVAAGVADRWDRRRIMLACDLVRAGLVSLIPFVRAAWWVFLWAFLLEGASLVFLPARDASVPDLVDEQDLPTANGLILASSYGNLPLGAGAFALLSLVPAGRGSFLGQHPNALAFWVDALTFLVSFLLIRRLAALGPAAGRAAAGETRPPGGGTGFRDALRLPVVRAVMPAAGIAMLGIGSLFSLGVVYVRQVLHASTGQFGGLVALFGVGGALGWAALQRLSHGTPTLGTVKAAIAAMGAVLAGMSLASNLVLAYAAAVPFGAAGAAALVGSVTYLQETLAGERRMLGLAVFHAVLRIGMSVAAIGGALLAQALAPVRLPWVGLVQPPAVVLFGAGLAMIGGATIMPRRLLPGRLPQQEQEAGT